MKIKPPFRLDKITSIAVTVFLGLILLGAATQCRGAEPVAQFELGHTVIRGPATAARLSVQWPDAGPKDAGFECGLTLIGEYEYKGSQPNQAIADCALVDGLRGFDFGIGPAYLQNIDTVNGSHFNFHLLARWTSPNGRHMVTWHHWSNAGTVKPNAGRDIVAYGYRF